MTIGGGAQPVITSTAAPSGGAAQPITVVQAPFYVQGGPARPVVVVSDNRSTLGGAPMPVYYAPAGSMVQAGPPLPVVVSSLGSSLYAEKVKRAASGLIAYWPLWESSGTVAVDVSGNGRDGAYTAVTLGQSGIGDGRTCPLFNGTSSFVNVFSASLQGAFVGGEGTLSLWMRVANAGVWTDGVQRRGIRLAVDGNNTINIGRLTTNNQFRWTYAAGAVTKSVTKSSLTTTDWMHIALTWSKSADLMVAYFNGTQEGTNNALGTWAGSLASTLCTIGATSTAPLDVWSGTEAHVALWNNALGASTIASLATP